MLACFESKVGIQLIAQLNLFAFGFLFVVGHHFLLCQQTNTKDIAGQSASIVPPYEFPPSERKLKGRSPLCEAHFHFTSFQMAVLQGGLQFGGKQKWMQLREDFLNG